MSTGMYHRSVNSWHNDTCHDTVPSPCHDTVPTWHSFFYKPFRKKVLDEEKKNVPCRFFWRKRVLSIYKGCGILGNNMFRFHKCELEIYIYKNGYPPCHTRSRKKLVKSHFQIQTRTRSQSSRHFSRWRFVWAGSCEEFVLRTSHKLSGSRPLVPMDRMGTTEVWHCV
jgi:hypothetical protein